jgi:hypothetical protein
MYLSILIYFIRPQIFVVFLFISILKNNKYLKTKLHFSLLNTSLSLPLSSISVHSSFLLLLNLRVYRVRIPSKFGRDGLFSVFLFLQNCAQIFFESCAQIYIYKLSKLLGCSCIPSLLIWVRLQPGRLRRWLDSQLFNFLCVIFLDNSVKTYWITFCDNWKIYILYFSR